jgi:hypothetical protein
MSDDAARQEAERRYPNKSVVYGGALLDDTRIEGFVAGAEWQASRTPVVADREALARRAVRAADEYERSAEGAPWPDVMEAWSDGERFTTHDLRALAAPVVADVDAIARVLGEHAAIPGSWSCACGLNPLVRTRVTLASHQAEQVAALGITVTGEADRG